MANSNKWSGYFKVVSPAQQTTKMTDSQEMADVGAYNNYTWYQRLIQGSASRMTRYREYDLMDNDVEVARALDTIAEEMTGDGNPNSHNPLDVEILTNEEDPVASQTIVTVRAALRRWSRIHDYENMLFHIARLMIKYGDVFFRKKKFEIHEKWKFIHPKNVIAALVDANDATKVVAWQIKTDVTKPRAGGYSMPLGAKQDSQFQTEIVPADEIVRFTLNNDMSDTAPFGESILRAVYRSHKQKELLEDSVLIYRIQRAPERRAFYIDVGKMPPQRVKQYLEQIKNEIRQKKVPSMNGGQESVDSVYNPQSMSEDFFFACLSMKSTVYLLDGRTLTLDEIRQEFEDGKENWTYSIDQKTKKLIPGKIEWAGFTRRNAEMIRVTLDNNEYIDCTPDHKFVTLLGTEVEAQNLTPGLSLMPLYKKHVKTNKKQKENLYEMTMDNSTGKYNYTHLQICKKIQQKGTTVIHHIDYDPTNNNPTNLIELTHDDHWKKHHACDGHTLGYMWNDPVERETLLNSIRNYHDNATPEQKQTIVDRNTKNGSSTWIKHEDKIRQGLNKGREITRNKFETHEQYCSYMSNQAASQWSTEKRKIQSSQTKNFNSKTKTYVITDDLFCMFIDAYNNGGTSIPKIKNMLNNESFINQIKIASGSGVQNKQIKISDKFVYKLTQYGGYNNFQDFKENYAPNHKVVSIEKLPYREDTGCLYVTDPGKNHNFAVSAGVYVKNSRPDGRGSKVETLPGGQGLGELADLEYFQRKVWRGLRVPASYMIEQQEGGQIWNDGKVGVAYIQELRFCIFVMRLQSSLEKVLDAEFKSYLRSANIQIDEQIYMIRLPEPSNFGKYKQLEVDGQLLSAYGTADGITYMSKRFILKRYLQLDDDEIILNERMLREERGMNPNDDNVAALYAPPPEPGMMGGGFGGVPMGMSSGNTAGGLPGAPGEGLPPGPGGAEGPGMGGGAAGGAAPAGPAA